MYPKLLDTKTGNTVEAVDFDANFFWWSEGSGSCDCNRSLAFSEDLHSELEQQFGRNICFGSARIIVVDVFGGLEGMTKKDVIEEMNSSYPKELAQK